MNEGDYLKAYDGAPADERPLQQDGHVPTAEKEPVDPEDFTWEREPEETMLLTDVLEDGDFKLFKDKAKACVKRLQQKLSIIREKAISAGLGAYEHTLKDKQRREVNELIKTGDALITKVDNFAEKVAVKLAQFPTDAYGKYAQQAQFIAQSALDKMSDRFNAVADQAVENTESESDRTLVDEFNAMVDSVQAIDEKEPSKELKWNRSKEERISANDIAMLLQKLDAEALSNVRYSEYLHPVLTLVKSKNKEISGLARDFLANNVEGITNGDHYHMNNIPTALWTDGNADQRQKSLEIAEDMFENVKDLKILISSVTVYFESADPVRQRTAKEFLTQSLDEVEGTFWESFRLGFITEMCSNSSFSIASAWATDFLAERLDKFGCKGKELLTAWAMSGPYQDLIIKTNLNAMFALEEKEVGIVRYLTTECGIKDFARYPQELLLEQFRSRDDTETPYGAVFFPAFDHNGAFYQEVNQLTELRSEVSGQFRIRVAECDTKMAIVRHLIRLNDKYGKISFGILGGHGSPTTIQMGAGGDFLSNLKLRDFRGEGTKRLQNYFTSDAEICMISCSTGAKGGIGEQVAKATGTSGAAPTDPANLKSFNATVNEGRIHFEPVYTHNVPTAYLGQNKNSRS
jgi:hypothetical protein